MIATYKFKMFGRARKKSFEQKNRHKLLPINMSHIRSKNPMGTALNCLGVFFYDDNDQGLCQARSHEAV